MGVQTWASYLWGLSLYKLLIAVDLTWNWTSRFLKCGNESGNDEFLVHVLWKLNTYLELYLNAEPYFWPWSFVLCWDHSFPKCRYQLWFVRNNQQLCLEGEVPRSVTLRRCFNVFCSHLNCSKRYLSCVFFMNEILAVSSSLSLEWQRRLEVKPHFLFGCGTSRAFPKHWIWAWTHSQTLSWRKRDGSEGQQGGVRLNLPKFRI